MRSRGHTHWTYGTLSEAFAETLLMRPQPAGLRVAAACRGARQPASRPRASAAPSSVEANSEETCTRTRSEVVRLSTRRSGVSTAYPAAQYLRVAKWFGGDDEESLCAMEVMTLAGGRAAQGRRGRPTAARAEVEDPSSPTAQPALARADPAKPLTPSARSGPPRRLARRPPPAAWLRAA